MRLALGVGYTDSSDSYHGRSQSFSGTSVLFDVALGGAITPNLVIFGEFVGHMIPDPTYKVSGYPSENWSGDTFNAIGIGPGLSYYIMPENMFVSGSLLFQALTLSSRHSDYSADVANSGIGFSLMLGKEWWVAADWGLGVAGQFLFGSAKDAYVDARWTTVSGGVLLTATYN
jgi:hypothetical protein